LARGAFAGRIRSVSDRQPPETSAPRYPNSAIGSPSGRIGTGLFVGS
jgi:hypothetical protein